MTSRAGYAGRVMDARWVAFAEATVPADLRWLSPLESARLAQVRFRKRRTEFLLRRWTGKHAVALALGLPTDLGSLARVALLNRLTGAPYVEVDGRAVDRDVSLSDRAGVAVAVVGGGGPGTLGIDLELVEPRTKGFVRDFLTPAEVEHVHARRAAGGEDAWQEAANLVWSAKEAALKVLRVGLRADTRTVEVDARPAPSGGGWAALRVTSVAGDVFPGWWRRDGVFLLTMAYAAGSQVPHPPALLPGGCDLARERPVHSWLTDPVR